MLAQIAAVGHTKADFNLTFHGDLGLIDVVNYNRIPNGPHLLPLAICLLHRHLVLQLRYTIVPNTPPLPL
jgi:hypothetical protein